MNSEQKSDIVFILFMVHFVSSLIVMIVTNVSTISIVYVIIATPVTLFIAIYFEIKIIYQEKKEVSK